MKLVDSDNLYIEDDTTDQPPHRSRAEYPREVGHARHDRREEVHEVCGGVRDQQDVRLRDDIILPQGFRVSGFGFRVSDFWRHKREPPRRLVPRGDTLPHGGVRPFLSKVNLPRAINLRAFCGANLVTQPSQF